jgi:molybdopterin molybdotransferase
MISVEQAIRIIARETDSLGSESVAIKDAVGRILAEDVIADMDMPPFDRSQMDGFALRAVDSLNSDLSLQIVGESAAGKGWDGTLKNGEAVRIMTGAPVPKGADAVQKIELVSESDDSIWIQEPTTKGRYIVKRGTEIRSGKRVLKKGDEITARNIAIPAAFGYGKIRVAQRPRVSILATGSEIVAVDAKPNADQIRNSNSVMLQAMASTSGCEPKGLPTAGDDIGSLRRAISKALKRSDILITTGGVSVGKYDLTKAALLELGAEIFFERVRLKPGKPTVFARLGEALVFGLPGNPVSAAVTFRLFIKPAVDKMLGRRTQKETYAVLATKVKAPAERDTYMPGKLGIEKNGVQTVEPQKWHGSSDFIGFAGADGLIVIPRGTAISAGTVVKVLRMSV